MQPMSLPWFIILLSLTQNPEPFRAHFLFNQQYIAVKIICRIPILHYKSCLLSMIKGAVPKGWHLKPPPRYGAEPLSLMPHTQNRLIQVIYQCSLQKPPSQMLLGQQPTQRIINIPPQSGGYFRFGHSPNTTGNAQVRFLLACQPRIGLLATRKRVSGIVKTYLITFSIHL